MADVERLTGAGDDVVSARVVVDAPASAVFALLVDPHRHGELDGSGTVGDRVRGPDRMQVGDRFTVAMKMFGVPYRITSTATRVEDDRVVEWRHPGGHLWRWELEDVDGNRTRVTESFDPRPSKAPAVYRVLRMHQRNAQGITSTLQGLHDRFAS